MCKCIQFRCVYIKKIDIFFIDFTAISVHLSQIVMCTKAILCILLN